MSLFSSNLSCFRPKLFSFLSSNPNDLSQTFEVLVIVVGWRLIFSFFCGVKIESMFWSGATGRALAWQLVISREVTWSETWVDFYRLFEWFFYTFSSSLVDSNFEFFYLLNWFSLDSWFFLALLDFCVSLIGSNHLSLATATIRN